MLAELPQQSAIIPAMPVVPDIRTTEASFKLAELAARSGLCKTRNAYDAFFVIGYGMELGIPPMTALRTIHVINNTPTCSGQAMLALIRRSGKVTVTISGSATEAKVTMKRRDTGDEYTAEWTMARANAAGVTGKDTWKKFPQQMLQWRAVSEAAVFLCSDIIGGLYTVEEIAPQITVDESGEPVDSNVITITPEPVAAPAAVEAPKHWSDDPAALDALVERACTAGYIKDCTVAELLKLLKVDDFEGYATRNEAALAVKAAGETAKIAAVSAQISTQQATETLGTGGDRRIGKTPEPEITGTEEFKLVTGGVSPFAEAMANPTPASGSNSAFNRGLNSYQAQQAQAQIEYQNEELDAMFARNMERDITP